MFKTFTRGLAAVVVSTLALGSGDARACCFSHCFGWCHPAPAPTFTQYAAPACNVCPQTVSYMPTTVCAPVCAPTCQPVSACDPCGGAQTFVQRPVMMPVTTFRPVVSQMNFPAPACPTCSGAAYYSPSFAGTAYQPAAAYAGVAAPGVAAPALAPAAPAGGCPTCGAGAAMTYGASAATYAAPASPYALGPAMSAPAMPAPAMSAPAPAGGSAAPGPTFDQNSAPAPSSSAMPLSPIPDVDKLNSNSAPRLMDPQNRTTSTRPLMGPANVTPAIFNVADRANVFHPASVPAAYQAAKPITTQAPPDGWSVGAPVSDGFESVSGR